MMNRLSLLMLSVFLIASSAYAQEQFFHGSWNEALKEAEKQKKLIFVDLYFEGCMPCDKMAKEVFPSAAVAKELNENFIAFKSDVFKEQDGALLSRKYAAMGFPTMIFLDGKGNTLESTSGYLNVEDFLKTLQEMVEKADRGETKAFSKDFDLAYPAFYSDFFMEKKRDFSKEAIGEFFSTQKDWKAEVPFVILSSFARGGKYDDFYLANAEELAERYSYGMVKNRVYGIINSRAKGYASKRDVAGFEKDLGVMKQLFKPEDQSRFVPFVLAAYYNSDPQHKWYIDELKKVKGLSSAQVFNLTSDVLGKLPTDKAALTTIKLWYEEELMTTPMDAEVLYNYSLIHGLTGNFEEGFKTLEKLKKMDSQGSLKNPDITALAKFLTLRDFEGFEPAKLRKMIPLLQ